MTVTFALALLPLVAAVGSAVDYTRASSTRTAMQTALDATVLNLIKTASAQTQAKRDSSAAQVFAANFNRSDVTNLNITAQYNPSTATLTLNGSASLPTQLMGLVGVQGMPSRASR